MTSQYYSNLQRQPIPTSEGYARQTRKNFVLPNQEIFQGRQLPVVSVGNSKPRVHMSEYVATENELRNFENRQTHRADDAEVRNLVTPPALQMNYLPYGWQRPREFERYNEYTRQSVKNVYRPVESELAGEALADQRPDFYARDMIKYYQGGN